MGDLYSRVRQLPDRIDKARAKLAKARRTLEWLGHDARAPDRKALESAQRRLAALENEARQYHFFDLLSDHQK
jgi:predicted  nucleic acid-binding Zn-ribbon protein